MRLAPSPRTPRARWRWIIAALATADPRLRPPTLTPARAYARPSATLPSARPRHNSYGDQALRLDLSFNQLSGLGNVARWTKLEELVLDNNLITDDLELCGLGQLTSLSLNNNEVKDLHRLVTQLKDHCPLLKCVDALRLWARARGPGALVLQAGGSR